ncbi:MAG: HD domain-containing protein [Desulfarculaceae bacterium]|jgi:HD-GYP domain-containing protein (c-di-GMP phosphodiesterase class II)
MVTLGKTVPELLAEVLSITQTLVSTQDLDFLLDKILSEARRILRAEAGSIYLVRGDSLEFTYFQNDKLVKQDAHMRQRYVGAKMSLDQNSFAGYAATQGKLLAVADAHHLPPDSPYSFNRSYDEASGYRTQSIISAPMHTAQGKVVGVLQLVNALNQEGQVVPFSTEDEIFVGFYANNAAFALERALMTRELILRMIRMAELRDPKETGAHVNRVGGYASEIYAYWAQKQGLDPEETKKKQDIIRVAAMLHDVGKVAISDSILKKPGKLSDAEYHNMKYHTIRGAQLLQESASDLDQMAMEIILNHHERWDGKGYPGHIDNLLSPQIEMGPGKQGQEIPASARITALADVFDALISPRTYKDGWPEDKVLKIIKEERGCQFDPEIVDAFFDVYDAIRATRKRYSEE